MSPFLQHSRRRLLGASLGVAMVACLLVAVNSAVGIFRDEQARLDESEAAAEARLAQRLDDLAITSLHLVPELRDPEDSVDDILEDLEDEIELVAVSLADTNFDAFDEDSIEDAIEHLRVLREADADPPPSLEELLPMVRALQSTATTLVRESPHAPESVAAAHTLATRELRHMSEAIVGRTVQPGDPRLAALLTELANRFHDLDKPEILVWDPSDQPSFEEFDQLTEIIIAVDESAFSGNHGSTDSRGPRGWLLLASTLAACAVGAVAVARHRRLRRSEVESVRRLRRLADRDPLTGLMNRSKLQQVYEAMLHHHSGIGVLYIDLDDFKAANDNHGHVVGDMVLREVADRIQRYLRADDRAARLGGDEFLVLLADVDPTRLQRLADRVVEVMAEPFCAHGAPLRVGASVGAAWATADEALPDVLARADESLYRAKRAGRGTARVAGPEPISTL